MNKNIFLIFIILLLVACDAEERIYDGPDIAYFDNKGIIREEIADVNTRITFRVVSPLAVGHDRQYNITKRFGSTMEEGVDYNFPKGRSFIISAGEYWIDINIDINPESLRATVDTLSFGLEALNGEVASFDSELQLHISKRCDFVPELYAGEYNHSTGLFPYQPDHTVTMEVVRNSDGSIDPNAIKVKKPYAADDFIIRLDYSNPKKVTPVVEMQQAGTLNTYDPWGEPVTVPFMVHTTEQHTYPRVFEKCENQSYLYACNGEFVIYMVCGVFFKDEDGSIIEGILGQGAAEERFTRLTPPYEGVERAQGHNIEIKANIINGK